MSTNTTEKQIDDYCRENGVVRTGVFATDREVSALSAMMRHGEPVFFVSDLDMQRADRDRHDALAIIHELARQKYGLPNLGKLRDLSDGEICDNRYGLMVNGEFNRLRGTPDGWEIVPTTKATGDQS